MGSSDVRTDSPDSRREALERLERLCREFHVDSLLPQLKAGEEALREHGVVDVAVSANHPLSEQDLNLLVEVSRHTPETAILLMKADLVSPGQLDAVVEFTKQQILQHTGKDLPILAFSNRPGFEPLRGAVRDHLFRRIVRRRAETFEEIVRHKIRFLVGGCRQYLALARHAAETAGKAREELREVLAREDRDMGSVESEIGLQVRDRESRVRTAAGERFHSHNREVRDRMELRLRAVETRWKGNLAKVTGAFREWLLEALEEELAEVSYYGETHLAGYLVESQSSFQRAVRAFQDRLDSSIIIYNLVFSKMTI